MSLLDEIRNERIKKGPSCTVGVLLLKLEKADAADLQAALDDAGVSATIITKVLAARGERLTAEAIRRHRRKLCFCDAG